MKSDRPGKSEATRAVILEAARTRLLADGFAGLSTRQVAETAGVPLSQLHYHFGSKQQMILALLDFEDSRRIARQRGMYAEDRPLWARYEQACDFLEDDLDSGYVRVLQEMIAVGWSNPEVAERVRTMLGGWVGLLTEVVREAEAHGSLAPFTAEEIATLVLLAFMGGESMILLGFDRGRLPVRSALRRLGVVIRAFEEGKVGNARSAAE
ncbi:MAG: TetR/AcrR family transcriptional regulator [Sporichthyaceae bacterium]